MSTTDRQSGAPADGEIVSARVLDAPKERVFRAFSDPSLLAQWWGPKGFTNTFHEFDLRPGGAWHFVMHGPDGTDYQNAKDFVEVAPPDRIVFRHVKPIHRFQMTMTFADEAGRTRLVWRMRFETLLESMSPAEWQRGGVHLSRGRLTLADWVASLAAHDDNHLDQLRRAVEGRQ